MLISANNHLGLMAMMFAIVIVVQWAERFTWVQKLSTVLLVIGIPLLLSNTGLIPQRAPAYDLVSSYFVLMAIPMLLLKADLKRIFSETGRLLAVFILATAGIASGVILAFNLIPLPDWGTKSAAVIAGGFTGGGVNFVAVAKAVELENPTHYAITLGADASASLLYLMLLGVLPALRWFRRGETTQRQTPEGSGVTEERLLPPKSRKIDVLDIGMLLGLSLVICAVGEWLAALVNVPQYSILIITLLALLVANISPQRMAKVNGDSELGMLLMYLFFVTLGAGTDLKTLVSGAPMLFLFAATVLVWHFLVVFGLGRLLGFSPREIATASNACVLGPATAAALASQQDWRELVTPGILAGTFGYVVGNFVGISIYALIS